MTDTTCAAFVLAGAMVAPHYHPHPISTSEMATSAAFEQLVEMGYHLGNKVAFAATFIPRRNGDLWILHRGGSDKVDIYLSALNGCVQKVIVID